MASELTVTALQILDDLHLPGVILQGLPDPERQRRVLRRDDERGPLVHQGPRLDLEVPGPGPCLREALEGIADNTSELALMTDDDMTEVLAPLRLKTLVERKVRSCLLGLKN